MTFKAVRDMPRTKQRWLVCGGRDFDDYELMEHVLDRLCRERGKPRTIINGAMKGADALSSYYCYRRRINTLPIGAKWGDLDFAAGRQRNSRMLARGPDFVVAFYETKVRSPGTKDMVHQSKNAGIEVKEVFPFHEF